MAEAFWKVSIYPHEGKIHVVCEWSDTCALTFTRDTLEEAFDTIRKEFESPREFALVGG
jgi:uncharacterized protein YdeI (YjbR/CyaY-like superfamily)